MESVIAAPRSQRLPSPLKEFIAEKVANGLVSDLPGPNCTRIVDEEAGTTTFVNATWVTQEAAQQFVDLYTNNVSVVSTAVVEV
jgi:hypothetical protein